MKTNKTINVAVFPFKDLVLYPNASIPMYIFEPAYIKMIQDALELDMPVALGLGDPVIDSEGREIPNALTPKKVMGIGKPMVIENYDDGSMYILLQGMGKVTLNMVVQDIPYLIFEATPIIEHTLDTHGFKNAPIERLRQLLSEWMECNVPDMNQRAAFFEKIKTVNHIIDYISMFLIQDRDLKQIILETENVADRIRLLDMLLLRDDEDEITENRYYGDILKRFEKLEKQAVPIQ